MTKEEYQNALNGYMNIDVHINKTLRLIGISAIKKQIPQKVKINRDFLTIMKCPKCEEVLYHKQNYCGECGQAIDWSEPYKEGDT